MKPVHVVLVRPRQSGNVGAAARAIANHGLGGLTLVRPAGFDPERARWMAPGAAEIIDRARIVGSVEEAVADAVWVVGSSARPRRGDWPVLDPAGLRAGVEGAGGPVAVLFGPEDTGLSNDDLALCHALLCLPTAAHASLNLGAAVTAMAAGLLALGTEATAPREAPPASASEQAGLVAAALEALETSGYLATRPSDQVQGTLYRLIGRAAPTTREIHGLRGMIASLRARADR